MRTTTLQTSEQPAPPPELLEQTRDVLGRYRGERDELIPILQDIQDVFGYLPSDAMREAARFLRVPEAVVYGVATYYAQFYLTRQGKHKIKICQGTACHVRGARRIMDAVTRKLGIGPGETTPDYRFSLERVACFGSCALAPVVVVNGKVNGRMTPRKALELLEKLD